MQVTPYWRFAAFWFNSHPLPVATGCGDAIKKQEEAKMTFTSSCFLCLAQFKAFQRITFRDARQKPLTSYDLWRDGWPARGDHSLWPFSHGSRACSRDGDCVAEMFFSLLYTYFIIIILCNFTKSGCKSTDNFRNNKELCEFYANFLCFFLVFASQRALLQPLLPEKSNISVPFSFCFLLAYSYL